VSIGLLLLGLGNALLGRWQANAGSKQGVSLPKAV
jgi:hypothetical protein